MVLLENDNFLNELTRFFQKSKANSKSVQLTMKKYDGRTKPKPREGRPQPPEPSEHKCLVRAVLGNKKISTIAYANVIKANMDGLKKKEKSKAKTKTKAKAI